MPEPITAPFVEDLQVREAYAEVVRAFFDNSNAVRLEFLVHRWTTEHPIRVDKIVPVARAVMPLGLAVTLRDQLTLLIEAADRATKLVQTPPASGSRN